MNSKYEYFVHVMACTNVIFMYIRLPPAEKILPMLNDDDGDTSATS